MDLSRLILIGIYIEIRLINWPNKWLFSDFENICRKGNGFHLKKPRKFFKSEVDYFVDKHFQKPENVTF